MPNFGILKMQVTIVKNQRVQIKELKNSCAWQIHFHSFKNGESIKKEKKIVK
jgi:hypothetical protein